jgi:SAM-dependent methyltransferase
MSAPDDEQDAPCGYCGQRDSRRLYETEDIRGNRFHIRHCQACRAYFLAPRPSDSMLADAYDTSYYGERTQKFSFPLIERALDYFRAGRARQVRRFLADDEAVLDIGCGNGQFLRQLSEMGKFELHGSELPGGAATRAAQVPGVTLHLGPAEQLALPPNAFKAITLFHVFEHLVAPQAVLQEISRLLQPNGVLVMSFPNIDSRQSRWFKGDWLHLDPPRHLFLFAPDDFQALMAGLGYELLETQYLSLEQNPMGLIQSLLNKISPKRELLFEALKGNRHYTAGYPAGKMALQKLFFLLFFPIAALSDLLTFPSHRRATVTFTFRKAGASATEPA